MLFSRVPHCKVDSRTKPRNPLPLDTTVKAGKAVSQTLHGANISGSDRCSGSTLEV